MKAKHVVILTAIQLFTIGAKAQWTVGITGGMNHTSPQIERSYYTDQRISGLNSWNVSAFARYSINDWLAVRAGLSTVDKSYRYEYKLPYKGGTHYDFNDTYLEVPVMADFSFGSEKWRGHCMAGGYIGAWVNSHWKGEAQTLDEENKVLNTYSFNEKHDFDSRRDNRFNAGLVGGVGLSYRINEHWEPMAEVLYYYDLTSYTKQNKMLNNPKYNSTLTFSLGVAYNF